MTIPQRTLFCFGLGYTAEALSTRLIPQGWTVRGTSQDPARRAFLQARGMEVIDFARERPVAPEYLKDVTHVLTSIAPDTGGDPVLDCHTETLRALRNLYWVGYLSSTAVYGNRDGAWVDEATPIQPSSGRALMRMAAEKAWAASGLPVHTFRLAGIYGPGRNALLELRQGTAKRIEKPGQVFSRVHVEDIAAALETSMVRPDPGALYNVSDDEPAPATAVVEYAAWLLGVEPPPLIPYAEADLTVMARDFYADNRRVSNLSMREILGVDLVYPTFREGLTALVPIDGA